MKIFVDVCGCISCLVGMSMFNYVMENGSKWLYIITPPPPNMAHISVDSGASAADGIQKEA